MVTYKSAYRWEDRVCLGEVIEFPGTVCFGRPLGEACQSLTSVLRDMAETNLLHDEPLPIPNPNGSSPVAELEEPIYW